VTEGALVGRGVGPRGANGPALQRLVHAFVGPVLLRPAEVNQLVSECQAASTRRSAGPWMPLVAKGTPLSVRMACGTP
jgi:hypothetical protein